MQRGPNKKNCDITSVGYLIIISKNFEVSFCCDENNAS